VKTAIDWNHLPDAVVQAGTPEAFKTAFKEHRQQSLSRCLFICFESHEQFFSYLATVTIAYA
jgi:hypothetical protein